MMMREDEDGPVRLIAPENLMFLSSGTVILTRSEPPYRD
jgi:hypothetical protein